MNVPGFYEEQNAIHPWGKKEDVRETAQQKQNLDALGQFNKSAQEPTVQENKVPLIDTSEISILEQCKHKNHTGKLQRRLREMTDA